MEAQKDLRAGGSRRCFSLCLVFPFLKVVGAWWLVIGFKKEGAGEDFLTCFFNSLGNQLVGLRLGPSCWVPVVYLQETFVPLSPWTWFIFFDLQTFLGASIKQVFSTWEIWRTSAEGFKAPRFDQAKLKQLTAEHLSTKAAPCSGGLK